MTKALSNWINEHKEEIEEQKEREEKKGQKCRIIPSGESVIDVHVEEITESVFEFTQNDGSINKVKRYFYWFKPQSEYKEDDEGTYPLLVPKSVHMAVIDNLQEYGDKLLSVKIKKTGTGKDTSYKVFPNLKK